MKGKMKAIIKKENKAGAVLDVVDIPKISPDEVLVNVKVASICGTDVHIFGWNEWAQSRIRTPLIIGHEFAGEVVEIGGNVKSLKVGDFVSAETHIPCNQCFQCKTGKQHICKNVSILGVDINGVFADYVALPEICAWKNSEKIPLEFASVQEPLGNAVYATLEGGGVAGKKVAIFGCGPTGLFAIGVAKVAGSSDIISIGKHKFRMEIAKKMGADHILKYPEDDISKKIEEITDGEGVDVVLEMTGSQDAINYGLSVLKKGGRFTAFGIPSGKVEIDITNGIIFKGAVVIGISGRKMFDTWYRVANLLESKRIDISPIITHKFPLDEYEKGFNLMMSKERKAAKILLFP